MKSHRNVHNLFCNTHLQNATFVSKIYQQFYHSIVYIAKEGHHIITLSSPQKVYIKKIVINDFVHFNPLFFLLSNLNADILIMATAYWQLSSSLSYQV